MIDWGVWLMISRPGMFPDVKRYSAPTQRVVKNENPLNCNANSDSRPWKRVTQASDDVARHCTRIRLPGPRSDPAPVV